MKPCINYDCPNVNSDWCWSCQYYKADHDSPQSQVVEHVHRTSNMSSKDFAELQQMRRKVDWLEGRLNELAERRKPKGKWD